ncbi:MAG: hypothetical protein GC180_09140 [Bacteroidetes bacterium]|nr:hypothetical protein [Bacteroidota bacterium]
MKKYYFILLILFCFAASARGQVPVPAPANLPVFPTGIPVLSDADTLSTVSFIHYKYPTYTNANNNQISGSNTSTQVQYFFEFATSKQFGSNKRRFLAPVYTLELLDASGQVIYSDNVRNSSLVMVQQGYSFYSFPLSQVPLVAFMYAKSIRLTEH